MWALAARQHGVVTRQQLLKLGLTSKQIDHGLATRQLHRLWRGVYAVGRPAVSREGRWLAAVLACGRSAALSHGSAAALWGIGEYERGQPEVSVPAGACRRQPGIRIRRRTHLAGPDVTDHRQIPVTSAVRTVIDLTARLGRTRLETVINEGANADLFTPDELRSALDERTGQPGVAKLRRILDRRTFRLTRSHLERLFLPLAERAGLPVPQTQVWLNGFEVDFYFEEIGLVVETDGLRYHRTPAQQARDRLRDHAHTEAGLVPLRFTHEQVRYEPGYVDSVLRRVGGRLARRSKAFPRDLG